MKESLLEHAFPHLHAKIAKSFLTITHRSASHAFLCSSQTALKVRYREIVRPYTVYRLSESL
jgi:hypothetical protein